MGVGDELRARPAVASVLAFGALILVGVALYLFQPWQLFFDTTVDESLPTATAAPTATSTSDAVIPDDEIEPDVTTSEEMPLEPTALRTGSFVDRSHPASGTATVYDIGDGTRVLRFEDLATDNGPDLFVYLSTAPPDAPEGEFDVDFVNLGRLKGNVGDQNYVIPADVDLDRYTTVAIWCDRFDVVFGAAPLASS